MMEFSHRFQAAVGGLGALDGGKSRGKEAQPPGVFSQPEKAIESCPAVAGVGIVPEAVSLAVELTDCPFSIACFLRWRTGFEDDHPNEGGRSWGKVEVSHGFDYSRSASPSSQATSRYDFQSVASGRARIAAIGRLYHLLFLA
ncbi:hypothetical protein [Lignipirellula cremea]|uniref:hypothetical protein n=1 Tax=Lignipirellula cremea TaxID=2528010 RepID=UPI0018D24FDC|nr:hypothetical protein [Lignipirellula cremea]